MIGGIHRFKRSVVWQGFLVDGFAANKVRIRRSRRFGAADQSDDGGIIFREPEASLLTRRRNPNRSLKPRDLLSIGKRQLVNVSAVLVEMIGIHVVRILNPNSMTMSMGHDKFGVQSLNPKKMNPRKRKRRK